MTRIDQISNNTDRISYRDAVQEFTETLDIPRVKSFIVSGASKRGWTTWLTAGVDKRVEALVPIVMPILNTNPNLNNMYRSLGGWTWAFRDYVSFPDYNIVLISRFSGMKMS